MNAIPRQSDFVPLSVLINAHPLCCPYCTCESRIGEGLMNVSNRGGLEIRHCRCSSCSRTWRQVVCK